MYILLLVIWLILNGKITLEIVLVGGVLTIGIAFLMNKLFGYTPARDVHFLKKAPVFLMYLVVLIFEILKTNLQMMRFILNEKRQIEPVLVTFHSGLKTQFGNYILANSITLTPGTITVAVDGDELVVHCLRKDFLDMSEDGVFVRWIRRLEA